MTRRTFGIGLFLLIALVVPLPMFGLEGANVPLGRFAQLAGALTILALVEGTGGMVGLFLLLFWGHVVLYGLVEAAAAMLVARVGGGLRRHGISVKSESPAWAEIQGTLARGDRRLAEALLAVERPSPRRWRRALEAAGLSLSDLLGERAAGEALPWAFNRSGVRPA